ncbi:MAG: hypothetical protein GY859_35920, partial [Desulfobacterales bacterium]|nr:hypothetical protein [Desulfobacterales bacterium]
GSLREFLRGEVRYAALEKTFPGEAETLHARLEQEFTERYETLKLRAAAGKEEEDKTGEAA